MFRLERVAIFAGRKLRMPDDIYPDNELEYERDFVRESLPEKSCKWCKRGIRIRIIHGEATHIEECYRDAEEWWPCTDPDTEVAKSLVVRGEDA
jgi:hypothetical protein